VRKSTIHWVSGKDLPDNSVDTIPPKNFIASAVVIDCSAQAAPSFPTQYGRAFSLTLARMES
jgi:kynurenine formamidase